MSEKNKKIPKLRFPEFKDDWEQRKLGEMGKTYTGNTPSTQKEKNWTNNTKGYVWVTPTDINSSTISDSKRHLSKCGWELARIVPENSVLITSIASLGKNTINLLPVAFNQQINAIVPQNSDSYFLLSAMEKEIIRFKSIAGQTATAIINKTEFEKFIITVPSLQEQQKIGNFFKHFDELITLHQRKLENLKKQKKSLLQKMFPKNESKFPELRFPNFNDTWEQRKFGEIFDLNISNNTLSRAELNKEKGEIKNIHYGDILTKYGVILDIRKEEVPYINDMKIKNDSKQFLVDGDIIIADTAEDETTGKAIEIYNIKQYKVVSGLHTIVCRPKEKKGSFYLGYYINSNSFKQQVLPLLQGVKVFSLNKSNLLKTKVIFPKALQEQQKIGNFFKHFDELITLHQRKLENLEKLKKGLLQQMFV